MSDEKKDVEAAEGEFSAAYGEYAVGLGDRVTLTPGIRYDYDGLSDQTLWSPRFSASVLAGSRTRLNLSCTAKKAFTISGSKCFPFSSMIIFLALAWE